MIIQFVEQSPDIIRVRAANAKHIGTIYREVDGFFVYDPENVSGYMTEQLLMELAIKLSELNADWNAQLAKEFQNSKPVELTLVEDDPFTNTRTGALF